MLAGTMTKLTESEMPALDALTERSADPAPWISDGEKYALIGLSVKITDRIATSDLPPHFFVLADTKFNIPAHWREWLGSIRADEVERSDLFLISKMPSSKRTTDVNSNPQPTREEARPIQACDGALPANTRHSRPQ